MGRIVAIAAVVLFGLNACGGSKTASQSPPQITISADGPLSPGLITASQLRRVPGFSTAVVRPLTEVKVFEDPDPRGPCGATVPVLRLDDAIGLSWAAPTIRGGAQLVIRRPVGEAKRFLTARAKDVGPACGVFSTQTAQGVTQEMKFEGVVRLDLDADQALAVVQAIKINGEVRAATAIEVRDGDVLSRAVVFTAMPMDNTIVRGIASLMAKALRRLE